MHCKLFFFFFFLLFYALCFCCVLCFSSLFLGSHLLMAPKKSIPSKNLIRHRGSSSFSSAPFPLNSVRFRDEKAQDDFFENFSDQVIHLKRQVILSNFPDTPLPSAFSFRVWASLCKKPSRCTDVFI